MRKQEKSKEKSQKKIENTPLLVKIVSIAHYIYAIVLPLAFIFYLVNEVKKDGEYMVVIFIFGIFMVGGILIFATLYFFIARGLWKLKNWARITTIVISSIFILSVIQSIMINGYLGIEINTITSILFSILLITLNIFILVSLTVPKEVREAFKENK